MICIFQKLRFPLKVEKHLQVKHLHIGAAGAFGLSFLFALVPFFVSRTYNEVGLCLPFYAGDYSRGYKYVLLYTVFMGVTTAVNGTLLALLFRSFLHLLKDRTSALPAVIRRDFLSIQRRLILGLVVYLLIQFVTLAFLALSCVGGQKGETGREWFTRIVVLETITWPLMGPLRNPALKEDTKKALRRLRCCQCLFPPSGLPGDDSEGRWALLKRTLSTSFRSTFSTQTTSFRSRDTKPVPGQSTSAKNQNRDAPLQVPLLPSPATTSPTSSPMDSPSPFHKADVEVPESGKDPSAPHHHYARSNSNRGRAAGKRPTSNYAVVGRNLFQGSVKEHSENMMLMRESPVRSHSAGEAADIHKESVM